MHKKYSGLITIQLSTIVEAQKDSTKERNSAHDGIDLDFLDELMYLVMAKGYKSTFVGFDLQLVGDATKDDIKSLNEAVSRAESKAAVTRGKATVTRISF